MDSALHSFLFVFIAVCVFGFHVWLTFGAKKGSWIEFGSIKKYNERLAGILASLTFGGGVL